MSAIFSMGSLRTVDPDTSLHREYNLFPYARDKDPYKETRSLIPVENRDKSLSEYTEPGEGDKYFDETGFPVTRIEAERSLYDFIDRRGVPPERADSLYSAWVDASMPFINQQTTSKWDPDYKGELRDWKPPEVKFTHGSRALNVGPEAKWNREWTGRQGYDLTPDTLHIAQRNFDDLMSTLSTAFSQTMPLSKKQLIKKEHYESLDDSTRNAIPRNRDYVENEILEPWIRERYKLIGKD